jgi:DNA invertase Pin-like site-specific DNA recombinase
MLSRPKHSMIEVVAPTEVERRRRRRRGGRRGRRRRGRRRRGRRRLRSNICSASKIEDGCPSCPRKAVC